MYLKPFSAIWTLNLAFSSEIRMIRKCLIHIFLILERERKNMRAGERERGRGGERENPKQAWSPMQGSILGPWDPDLSQKIKSQLLN